MLEQKNILALIPARGNSKGLPGKNTMPLAGKPLIQWSIDAARQSLLVDRTVVTTDCNNIATLAEELGADVPFIRPADLAQDDTPGTDVVIHACEQLPQYEVIVLLQPTSPLRSADDIDSALHHFHETNADFCLGVTQPKHHPNWLFSKTEQGTLQRYEQSEAKATRQALAPLYAPNGAIYIASVKALHEQRTLTGANTVAYEMSAQVSWDIDTAHDMQMCEFLLSAHCLNS